MQLSPTPHCFTMEYENLDFVSSFETIFEPLPKSIGDFGVDAKADDEFKFTVGGVELNFIDCVVASNFNVCNVESNFVEDTAETALVDATTKSDCIGISVDFKFSILEETALKTLAAKNKNFKFKRKSAIVRITIAATTLSTEQHLLNEVCVEMFSRTILLDLSRRAEHFFRIIVSLS